MQIRDMNLVHHLKSGPTQSLHLSVPHLFHLDTCQRQLWITAHEPVINNQEIRTYTGQEAYEKLLAIACGLESRIIGETEIFAQLKNAWRDYQASHQGFDDTDMLLAALFEDTKFIRSNYLSGIGGQSYGTLIRKLVAPTDASFLLLAGAGKLAESVAQALRNRRLILTNRSTENARKLAARLAASGADVSLLNAVSSNFLATHLSVTEVIICRPFDAVADQRLARLPAVRNFVHLGASDQDLASLAFAERVTALSLDAVFALQSSQDELRAAQVARARSACRERATLRCLGSSVTLPHGWEDLAAFG